MKTCTSCQVAQPLDQFHRHAKTRDRLQSLCKECTRAYRAAHYRANRHAVLRATAEYRKRNLATYASATARWREKNPDAVKHQQKRRQQEHPDSYRVQASMRRAAKRNATPLWFGELDRLVLKEAQHLAVLRQRATGFAWHVDHVVPLRGKSVCGLHTWNNFAVIPAAVNLAKRNHFSPAAA